MFEINKFDSLFLTASKVFKSFKSLNTINDASDLEKIDDSYFKVFESFSRQYKSQEILNKALHIKNLYTHINHYLNDLHEYEKEIEESQPKWWEGIFKTAKYVFYINTQYVIALTNEKIDKKRAEFNEALDSLVQLVLNKYLVIDTQASELLKKFIGALLSKKIIHDVNITFAYDSVVENYEKWLTITKTIEKLKNKFLIKSKKLASILQDTNILKKFVPFANPPKDVYPVLSNFHLIDRYELRENAFALIGEKITKETTLAELQKILEKKFRESVLTHYHANAFYYKLPNSKMFFVVENKTKYPIKTIRELTKLDNTSIKFSDYKELFEIENILKNL